MKICTICKKEYQKKADRSYKQYEKSKVCSRVCFSEYSKEYMVGNKFGKGWTKGKKHSSKTIKKISESCLKNPSRYWLGKKRSPETVQRMKEFARSRKGENSGRWIKDRNLLKDSDRQAGHKYRLWREAVFIRDNYKCFFNDKNCCGKLEAHHILRWNDFAELRYEVKNGISVCHYHHPRKKEEEQKLIKTFSECSGLLVNTLAVKI